MFGQYFFAAQAGGVPLSTQSAYFQSSDDTQLNRTWGTATNQIKWTCSYWIRRQGGFGASRSIFSAGFTNASGSVSTKDKMGWNSSNGIRLNVDTSSGDSVINGNTAFSSTANWVHVVIQYDSAQSSNSNRRKIFFDGSEDSYSRYDSLNQNYVANFNQNSAKHRIGQNLDASHKDTSYVTEIHWIDGQVVAPSEFSQNNASNIWVPKQYSGTYGAQGCYLNFASVSSSSDFGIDRSGNGNNWSVSNMTTANHLVSDHPSTNLNRY